MIDNRKWQRVGSKLRCWCEGENITVYARVGNLSEGGMFLRTSTPLKRGSQTRLRFGSSSLEATARVVWIRSVDAGEEGPPGMGLEFENIDDRVRDAIRALMNESPPSVNAVASN